MDVPSRTPDEAREVRALALMEVRRAVQQAQEAGVTWRDLVRVMAEYGPAEPTEPQPPDGEATR
jgi:hypothetical protein